MVRAITAVLLCGAAHAAAAQEGGRPIELSAKQVQMVKKGVVARLKDPDSARFDRPFVAAASATGSLTVCGYVNAKNSYGGYTGPVAFGGMLMGEGPRKAFLTFGIGTGGASGDYAVRSVCERSGVRLD